MARSSAKKRGRYVLEGGGKKGVFWGEEGEGSGSLRARFHRQWLIFCGKLGIEASKLKQVTRLRGGGFICTQKVMEEGNNEGPRTNRKVYRNKNNESGLQKLERKGVTTRHS